MKDSGLKRMLVSSYFSCRELADGVRSAFGQPEYRIAGIDYDSYWVHRGPSGVQPRFQIIAAGLHPGETLLDVGCGDGAMLEYVRNSRHIHGIGLDISEVAVRCARERGVDARVQTLAQFSRETEPDAFDHVVISEVLEHVPEPEQFLRQGMLLCRRSLWLTFPNIAYFRHRLRLALGKFPVQWVVFPGEHLRFWSVPDFRHWLKQLGVEHVALYPTNGVTLFGLHRLWPNLWANQVVAKLDKGGNTRVH